MLGDREGWDWELVARHSPWCLHALEAPTADLVLVPRAQDDGVPHRDEPVGEDVVEQGQGCARASWLAWRVGRVEGQGPRVHDERGWCGYRERE
eukprot:3826364-Pyramimonas_sp.AAC.2